MTKTKIEYISPSRISCFHKSPEEFYLRYLCKNRPPQIQQTRPMAVGSAFDAYVKAYLYKELYGKRENAESQYAFEALFETQVESHNRDWARKAGLYAFMEYKQVGALADLLLMLQGAVGDARFEFEVRGAVGGMPEKQLRTTDTGMVFLGKPDLAFNAKVGDRTVKVVLDWKVSGFCSIYSTSPMKGYIRLRGRKGGTTEHKDAMSGYLGPIRYNKVSPSAYWNIDWLRQVCIYSWLLGIPVGSEFMVGIDQLVCKPDHPDMPDIRVAEYRCLPSPEEQYQIYNDALHVWTVANSDHFFRDMSLEESKLKEKSLDDMSETLQGKSGDEFDKWMAGIQRESYNRMY